MSKNFVKMKTGKAKKKNPSKELTLDCTHPVEDGIMDITNFEQFLKDKVKVEGKLNKIVIETEKNKVVIKCEIPFSKRYAKYLSKKYLKKNTLRDWLRVVASSKDAYEFRYFQINTEEVEEEED